MKFIWTTKRGLQNQEENLAKVLQKLTGAKTTLTNNGEYKAFYNLEFIRKPSPTEERYVEDIYKRLRALMSQADSKNSKMEWVVKKLASAPTLKQVKVLKSRTKPKTDKRAKNEVSL